MSTHTDLSDEEFEQSFASGELASEMFSHDAHLRLAWIHVKKYGVDKACDNLRQQIKSFVKKVGAEDKYHDTVTMASTQAVDHFYRRSKSKTFDDFIEEFPRLRTHMKDLLSQHYSEDIFQSESARLNYRAPDLLGFE